MLKSMLTLSAKYILIYKVVKKNEKNQTIDFQRIKKFVPFGVKRKTRFRRGINRFIQAENEEKKKGPFCKIIFIFPYFNTHFILCG